MFIVDKDGNGDFTGLQEAIDAIPEGNRAPTLVLIRPGVYREKVTVHKSNIRIVGADRETTVLTWNGCAKDPDAEGNEKGTFRSATLMVTGHNVEVENLTVRNDAGDGREVGQAVAVYAAGDRGVWRGCRLIAHQDTLFCGPLRMPNVTEEVGARRGRAEAVTRVEDGHPTCSRQYFENCYIEGDVDFIFGSYRCWFEGCTLFMGVRGGWYTAANTNRDQPYGFVFHRCRLTGACEEGKAFLGRPWRAYARTVFLECEMDACVAPEGFADWDQERVVTERLGEWRTAGVRADQRTRHPAQKRLTDGEASQITLPQVLSGYDGWRPDRRTPVWFLCGDSTMADYPAERAPMKGWGQMLQALLPEDAFVQNEAVCGRSSKSFVEERLLENIEACLRPGDRLVVSFSHNDEKPDPARHTDPETTFPEYLKLYLAAARRHEARPLLVTPICRRLFDEAGLPVLTHGAYPDAMRSLAEQERVPLTELEGATWELLRQAGPEGTKKIFCHVAPGSSNYPEGLMDNSHLQEDGAARIAALFLALLNGTKKAVAPSGFTDREDRTLRGMISEEDRVLR